MKAVDRLLRRWRMAKASRWIPSNSRVFDVGCGDGALFRLLKGRGVSGEGLDPGLEAPLDQPGVRLRRGKFPEVEVEGAAFDAITMLAVMEHIPREDQPAVARRCWELLRDGGRVVLTVPSPQVDVIARWLVRLRLIDGMALEEHYGFEVKEVAPLFGKAGFRLVKHGSFQCGLNHLFVFDKRGRGKGRE